MDAEIGKKWVEALRSGEYEQTSAFLRSARGFCCLGVLCDLHRKENDGYLWETRPTDTDIFVYSERVGDVGGPTRPLSSRKLQNLPEKVLQWSGIKDPDAILPVEKIEEALGQVPDELKGGLLVEITVLNDYHKLSFEQIASIIEKSLDVL